MADSNASVVTANRIGGGVFTKYSVMPHNLTQYSAYRGVTDFTQIGQFDLYERGYSFLKIIQMPKFILAAAKENTDIATMAASFKHAVEYEFLGLDGIPNIETTPATITDGNNEVQYINKVTMDTSITVNMRFYEKTGSLFEKFSEYYITGIKDRFSQAKTYHGLIRRGKIDPGLENEVFTLLYYVTDNTMLRLERAVLLCNAQITNAQTSMYEGNRGDISNFEYPLSFYCFPVMGEQVDKAASTLLEDISGVRIDGSVGRGNPDKLYKEQFYEGEYKRTDTSVSDVKEPFGTAVLDSSSYRWGIMGPDYRTQTGMGVHVLNTSTIDTLQDAIEYGDTTQGVPNADHKNVFAQEDYLGQATANNKN